MKKLTLSILISLLLCAILSIFSGASEVNRMTEKLIRLHVIANSDSEYDQSLKLEVRDAVLECASRLLSGCNSKAEVMERLESGLPSIEAAAREVLETEGCGCDLSCTLQKETFSERAYEDFTLPAGEYDSLCLRIGRAEGRNWWCVCYPRLCFGSAVSIEDCGVFSEGEIMIVKEPEKVRYKLWCYETIRKLIKLFR